jgi:hypothetical protein
MNKRLVTSRNIVVLVALTIAIALLPINIGRTEPSYAQPTFGTPTNPGSSSPEISGPSSSQETSSSTETGTSDEGDNFQQFMSCLFGGEVSAEDITNALDGSSDSTPTEQDIRDCFDPLYPSGATDTSTDTDGDSTTEPDVSGDSEATTNDEGDNGADGGTSEGDEESD